MARGYISRSQVHQQPLQPLLSGSSLSSASCSPGSACQDTKMRPRAVSTLPGGWAGAPAVAAGQAEPSLVSAHGGSCWGSDSPGCSAGLTLPASLPPCSQLIPTLGRMLLVFPSSFRASSCEKQMHLILSSRLLPLTYYRKD